MADGGGLPQAHLDALAQQQGYPNYAGWQRAQAVRLSNGLNGTNAPTPQTSAPPANWLQNLMESIPGHPAYVLRHVADSLSSALGGK